MPFKGTNEQGTIEGFFSRLNFKVNIDRDVKGRSQENAETSEFAKCLKDFKFAERTAYGKIDTTGAPVLLSPDRDQSILKKVNSSDDAGVVFVVNFVADAFEEMRQYFKAARNNGKLDLEDPYLADPTAYKGYVSFEGLKEAIREQAYRAGFLNHIVGLEKLNGSHIGSFDLFMRNFLHFADSIAYKTPFTKGEMLKNKIIPIRTSGLVIELAVGDFSKDNPKDLLFYKSNNFDYYLNVAMKVGFSVDRNAPWRLVADLGSPTMKAFMRKYDITGPNAFFTGYCRDASQNDFQEFIDFTLNLYASYVAIKNNTARPVSRGKLTLTERFNLQTINELTVYQSYGSDYFIDSYIELKNIENRDYVGKRELEVLKDEIAQIRRLPLPKLKKHNRIGAVIEGKFAGFRGKGTMNDIKKKLIDKQEQK